MNYDQEKWETPNPEWREELKGKWAQISGLLEPFVERVESEPSLQNKDKEQVVLIEGVKKLLGAVVNRGLELKENPQSAAFQTAEYQVALAAKNVRDGLVPKTRTIGSEGDVLISREDRARLLGMTLGASIKAASHNFEINARVPTRLDDIVKNYNR